MLRQPSVFVEVRRRLAGRVRPLELLLALTAPAPVVFLVAGWPLEPLAAITLMLVVAVVWSERETRAGPSPARGPAGSDDDLSAAGVAPAPLAGRQHDAGAFAATSTLEAGRQTHPVSPLERGLSGPLAPALPPPAPSPVAHPGSVREPAAAAGLEDFDAEAR